MAELGKKLGKLSLAILENFVEGVLGEKFVGELRESTDREIAVTTALGETETIFISTYEDKDLSKALFVDLKQANRPVLKEAVGQFFDHPTKPDLRQALQTILFDELKEYLSKERIDKAVDVYIKILTKELMLADERFRDNIAALMTLEGSDAEQRSAEYLEKIAGWVLQQQSITQNIFRSLYQLPQPPADFTGREEMITQLLEDFNTHKGAAISGLTGMGGLGKTALGLVVAHRVAEDYPDAQIFIDLKGTTEPLSAADILRHVILSFEPDRDVRTQNVEQLAADCRSVLQGRQVLIFLDNARSAEQIACLQPSPSCALLVTSRWVFDVPDLQNHRLDRMSEGNAKEFLLKLCPRIGDLADELARGCGYLPLALRIAGSFLKVNLHWSVNRYLERLSDPEKRLSTFKDSRSQIDLSKEHPYLHATFELSYSQLSPDDQKRWRTLGVFPASFNESAARAIWDLDEDETVKQIGLLLSYSLLDYDETSARYSLHDLLAEYARSQMAQDEETAARIAHADHYADVLYEINQMYLKGGENILPALRLYDGEWANIEAGQKTSVLYMGRDQKAAGACNWYAWQGSINDLRLLAKDRIHWLEDGLRASKVLKYKKAEAAHLGNLGNAYSDLGDARKATDYHEQQLVIAREIGDRRGEGIALGNLGNAYLDLGDARKATDYHEQQLVIVRETGDRRGEGLVLGNLGIAYKNLGEVHKAIDYYEQSLVITREIGDRLGEGAALGNLGNAYADLGDLNKAIDYYEQRLIIAREIGDRRGEGNALNNLGNAYKNLGDLNKAIDYYEQRLIIAREIGDRRGEALGSWNLGIIYEKQSELEKAIEAMQICVDYERQIGHPDAEKDAAYVEELRKKLVE
jgi:tetratricopeptide (TPR) repeat protein